MIPLVLFYWFGEVTGLDVNLGTGNKINRSAKGGNTELLRDIIKLEQTKFLLPLIQNSSPPNPDGSHTQLRDVC